MSERASAMTYKVHTIFSSDRRDAPVDDLMRAWSSLDDGGETRGIDEEARAVDFIASTEAEDGHGTVIDQGSWKLGRFRKNPVCLYSHNVEGPGFFGGGRPGDSIPIARAEKVRVEDGKLKARIVFPPEGEDELSDRVWKAIVSRRLNGMSVGFRHGKVAEEELPGGRKRYRLSECTLFELSIVALPSNPECIAERSLLAKLSTQVPVAAEEPDTTARSVASMEKPMNWIEILAKRFGCAATEADVLAALEAQGRSVSDLTARAERAEGEFANVRTANESLSGRTAVLDAALSALGLDATADAAVVTKSIVALTSRAAQVDALETSVAELRTATDARAAADAKREVAFICKRGASYGLKVDGKSERALIAFRQADPTGFAEEYKVALDGLREFDDPALFASVTTPEVRTAVTPSPADMANKGATVDANGEIKRVADEMQAQAKTAGKTLSRADALEAARRKVTG